MWSWAIGQGLMYGIGGGGIGPQPPPPIQARITETTAEDRLIENPVDEVRIIQ